MRQKKKKERNWIEKKKFQWGNRTRDLLICLRPSLIPRPCSTLTFGGPGMPNQIFEWVGPRQRFCTQCHYDNFLGTPTATYSLLEKSGAAAIIGEW